LKKVAFFFVTFIFGETKRK